MLGAIAGDVIGSVYEHRNHKRKDFPLFTCQSHFTDDTVLTVAIADTLLNNGNYVDTLHRYFELFPRAGYGTNFTLWASLKRRRPYNSWGNGSAMRVSPIGYAAASLEDALEMAAASAAVTHNHREGIRGAQATAAAIFLARRGQSKEAIKDYVQASFGYNLERSLAEIRPVYSFDVSCQGSVPEAIIAFLESTDFEDAIRNAVSLGGDSDTLACIAGGIAQAFYGGVPGAIATEVLNRLHPRLRAVTEQFLQTYEC